MTEKTDQWGNTAPTNYTIRANQAIGDSLPLEDQQDFEDSRRGLIASDPNLKVKNDADDVIWDMSAFDFIQGDAPDSVNPSLWRQAILNNIHGLFEVTEGIYQVRGYDAANLTIIEGNTGWIIVDPLTSMETTAAAFELAKTHLGAKPVVAIIHTHSHLDHYGGVWSIATQEEVAAGGIRIIAPQGYLEESLSEITIAGFAMLRRSSFQFGTWLPRSERGHVDTGLCKSIAAGSTGILVPTEIIDHTPQEVEIDGVRFIFQNCPESEAVAELAFYLPDFKAYCGAEIVTQTQHNIYTLRGTKARDALKWSNYIDEAIELFGDAEIFFASHHWPVWDHARVIEFLKKQRDIYKYIHDQTLRLASSGYTPREIAEQMTYPETLRTTFNVRGYYGTLQHNAKAVYTYYFGWYDANPANLNPLPPEESGKRYVSYMGGADALLARARKSFDEGDYRWVAEVLNHLVFAEPENEKAKELLACTYDQLGYQSESGPWRDVYLNGAYELRHGPPKGGPGQAAVAMLKLLSPSVLFDAMSTRLNPRAADGKKIAVNITFTDIQETYVLTLENAVLHHKKSNPNPEADATLKISYDLFPKVFTGQANMAEVAESGALELEGNLERLVEFFSLFERPQQGFNIVTP